MVESPTEALSPKTPPAPKSPEIAPPVVEAEANAKPPVTFATPAGASAAPPEESPQPGAQAYTTVAPAMTVAPPVFAAAASAASPQGYQPPPLVTAPPVAGYGSQQYGSQPPQQQPPYGSQPQQPYGSQPQQSYGSQPQQPYGSQYPPQPIYQPAYGSQQPQPIYQPAYGSQPPPQQSFGGYGPPPPGHFRPPPPPPQMGLGSAPPPYFPPAPYGAPPPFAPQQEQPGVAPFQSLLVGHPHTDSRLFDDLQYLGSHSLQARIAELRVFASHSFMGPHRVAGLQLVYDVNGVRKDGPIAGATPNAPTSLQLDLASGESIEAIFGRVDAHGIEALTIVTTRRTESYGSHSAGSEFQLNIPPRHRVTGFHGAFGPHGITALGAYATPV